MVAPIAIVGMGPAGLTAAIEAAKKGYEVNIIDTREHFSRTQRVILGQTTLDYLKSLADTSDKEDQKFLARLKADAGTAKIYRIQLFLERKLKKYNNIHVYKGNDYAVTDVNLTTRHITLKHKKQTTQIPFSHFVAADGGRRSMADLICQHAMSQNKDSWKIEFKDLDKQTRQVAHGTVTLEYKGKDKPSKKANFKRLSIDHMPLLQALGWDEAYIPKCYVFTEGKGKKFYVAGEIPQKILNETDKYIQREMLVQWGKLILELQEGYHVNEGDFDLALSTKDKIVSKLRNKTKATAFPVHLRYTEASCLELADGYACVSIGDAYKDANFHLGHGTNDAIADALAFAQSLSTMIQHVTNEQSKTFDAIGFMRHQAQSREIMLLGMKVQEEKDQKAYGKLVALIDEKVVKEARTLIQMANQFSADPNIKAHMENLSSSIESLSQTTSTPLRPCMEQVYTATIALADDINKQAEAAYEENLEKLKNTAAKNLQETKKLIAKKEEELHKLESTKTKLFTAVSVIIPPIALGLWFYNTKTKKALNREIAQLKIRARNIENSNLLSTQTPNAKYDMPHRLKELKTRLDQMMQPDTDTKSRVKVSK